MSILGEKHNRYTAFKFIAFPYQSKFFFLMWHKRNSSSSYLYAGESYSLGGHFDATVHWQRYSDEITMGGTTSSSWVRLQPPPKLKLPWWLGFVFVKPAVSSIFFVPSSSFTNFSKPSPPPLGRPFPPNPQPLCRRTVASTIFPGGYMILKYCEVLM